MLQQLRASLRKAGLEEGRHFIFSPRYADDSTARLAQFAGELVREKVDLIYAVNTPASVAAKKATDSIPIVFVRVADPVAAGLVKSLAHPAGNATGFVPFTPELAGKRLEILKQAIPATARVSVLWASANRGAAQTFRQFQDAGAKLNIGVHNGAVAGAADIDRAIGDALQAKCTALMLIDDVVVTAALPRIVARAAQERLAVTAIYREAAESGALMAFGPNPDEIYEGAADYTARIMSGTAPAQLPVRQPSRFQLIVNLKTANALQVKIPQALLSAADRVIQ